MSGICTCSRALCGGSCVSLDDDPLNCGACGHDCLGGTCVQGLCQPVKIVDDPSPSSMVLYQDHLYWLSGTNVKRAALDGSSVTPLASGVDAGGYNGPSFAVTAGGVFWSSYWQIFGIPLDGSAPATMLVNEYDSGFELTAMTADESHLYWATAYGPIKRSNLDGTNVITLPVNVNETYSLAVNATKLYWSNLISYQMGLVDLVSSNLDGSNPTTLTAAVTGPTILATATHVYWGSSGQIWRRAVGGTTNEPLTSGNFECLAADATSIYWGGTVTASGITVAGIFRTPASGGTSMLLHPVLPRAVAVDTRFLYYTWNDYGSLTRHGVMRLAK